LSRRQVPGGGHPHAESGRPGPCQPRGLPLSCLLSRRGRPSARRWPSRERKQDPAGSCPLCRRAAEAVYLNCHPTDPETLAEWLPHAASAPRRRATPARVASARVRLPVRCDWAGRPATDSFAQQHSEPRVRLPCPARSGFLCSRASLRASSRGRSRACRSGAKVTDLVPFWCGSCDRCIETFPTSFVWCSSGRRCRSSETPA